MWAKVGIREAKANLSKYIKMVKNGNEVILTERGKPVGKIVPISDDLLSLSNRLKKLEESGLLESKTGKKIITPSPIRIKNSPAQKMLLEDRGE